MLSRFKTAAEADRATCELHNQPGCSSCNKAEGECDYGSCQAPAVRVVMNGTEPRPACARHLKAVIVGGAR